MSFKKFGRSDVIRNAMRAYPHNTFFIYSSSVYYDHRPIEEGQFNSDILSASGGISIFEYNVDRSGSTTFTLDGDSVRGETDFGGDNPPIVPYVIKGTGKQFLKASPRKRVIFEGEHLSFEIFATGAMQEVADDYLNVENGSFLTGASYPMSASIVRELMTTAGGVTEFLKPGTTDILLDSNNDVQGRPNHRHYYGLRNSLNFYGVRSPHYLVEYSATNVGDWNKDEQDINLISIPKIFYGSRIKPGSMSLKFYITGTLVGELKDEKYNGELIQVGPVDSNGSGSVAGVAMYEEGFVLLTGRWDLTEGKPYDLDGAGGSDTDDFVTGSWKYFAAGANDSLASPASPSASFDMSFKGHTETQVLTMYAHARRGEVNYSNNPTFLQFGQDKVFLSSSNIYIENDQQKIKNTVSSSFSGFEAPFERQVYVSRVAVYDDDKKLIGVATLSNPVLKKEAQDLSFKLKLDI